MRSSPFDLLLFLLLTLLGWSLWRGRVQVDHQSFPPKSTRPSPRPLRPRTPDDCPQCRDAQAVSRAATTGSVVPYAQRKSRRGRKKTVDTQGQACPNPDCDYHNITDPAVHAVVGYGYHGQTDPIQDFFC